MNSILKFNHPDRAKAKVIRVINSCAKFEQLRMAYEMIRNYWNIYTDEMDDWMACECNREYINKYNELRPKDDK